MTNQESIRIKNEISTSIKFGNISSLLDFIEAEVEGLIDDIYGSEQSEEKEKSRDYLEKIKGVLKAGPPFTDKQIKQVEDILCPLIFTHDMTQ